MIKNIKVLSVKTNQKIMKYNLDFFINPALLRPRPGMATMLVAADAPERSTPRCRSPAARTTACGPPRRWFSICLISLLTLAFLWVILVVWSLYIDDQNSGLSGKLANMLTSFNTSFADRQNLTFMQRLTVAIFAKKKKNKAKDDSDDSDDSDESDNDARNKKSVANDDFSDTDSDDAENENEDRKKKSSNVDRQHLDLKLNNILGTTKLVQISRCPEIQTQIQKQIQIQM